VSEQTAPLPLFFLAVAFLLVWNMDPVSEESAEPNYVEMHYSNPLDSRAQHLSSEPENNQVSTDDEDLETEKPATK
jgi:hypothetical protein